MAIKHSANQGSQMRKLDEPTVPKRIVLTKTLEKLLQEEANSKANGNVSLLVRNILIKRYKVNKSS